MLTVTITNMRTLAIETCCACGVEFGMTSALQAQRKRDQKQFYCPNGHPQSYTESEAERLARDLARALERAQAETLARDSLNAEIQRLGRSIIGLRGRLTQALGRRRR